MRIVVFANSDWFIYNFSRSLIEEIRNRGGEAILLAPRGNYAQQLEDLGFRFVDVPLDRKSTNVFKELYSIFWLFSWLKKNHVDIIHSFTLKCAIYGSIASKIAGTGARVNSLTGLGYVFTSKHFKAVILRPLVKFLLFISLGGSRTVLTVLNRDDYLSFKMSNFIRPRSVELIYGAGVDCDRFSPAVSRVSTSQHNKFRVLLAARLLWDKGLAEFVEAARICKSKYRNVEFLIAGDTDQSNPSSISYEQLEAWQDEDVVTFLGHIECMEDIYKQVSVVVLPSFREGLPTVLAEAAACGLPLIATDVPGCREVVKNKINGYLVPVNDPIAISQSISMLLNDNLLCENFGIASRRFALDNFDQKIINAETLCVYHKLLHN